MRDIKTKIRISSNQDELLNDILAKTILENRDEIEHKLLETKQRLVEIEKVTISTANDIDKDSKVSEIKKSIFDLQDKIRSIEKNIALEEASIESLDLLSSQYQSQSIKIAKSISSKKYLGSIEFILCPRCGSHLDKTRIDESHCYLCLQEPGQEVTREELIKEQRRVESEFSEIIALIEERKRRISDLNNELVSLRENEKDLNEELNFRTSTFISEKLETLSSVGEERATLKERIERLESYIVIFSKIDDNRSQIDNLKEVEADLEAQLESQKTILNFSRRNLKDLSETYSSILESYNPPAFGDSTLSSINEDTYIPTFRGRKFETLSSPGLGTLVNVAHALAHQIVSIEKHLRLPNILIIDGLSEHLGQEGLDPERLEAVYKSIVNISEKYKETLQIIIMDNHHVPDFAEKYVKLRLTEAERLII